MKTSDLVSIQVLVEDAIAFFKQSDFDVYSSPERYIFYSLLDVLANLSVLISDRIANEC